MANYVKCDFPGFADLAEAIDRAGGDLHTAVEEALSETQHIITEKLKAAARPYQRGNEGLHGYATGAMYDAIIDKGHPVAWRGNVAEVTTGFSSNGGETLEGYMHSRWVMYGNNRGMDKDPKVYNAVKGPSTTTRIRAAQKRIMEKYLTLTKEASHG